MIKKKREPLLWGGGEKRDDFKVCGTENEKRWEPISGARKKKINSRVEMSNIYDFHGKTKKIGETIILLCEAEEKMICYSFLMFLSLFHI